MTEQQIKEYLQKYSITSKELLYNHIEELNRNTIPNLRLISELVFISEDSFYNFLFGEKNYKRGINNHIANATNTPFFLDEVIQANESANKNTNSTKHKSQYGETHKGLIGDLESTNKLPKIEQLSYQSFSQVVYTKPTSNWNKFEITFSDNDFEKIKGISIGDILFEEKEKPKTFTVSTEGINEGVSEGIKESQTTEKAPIFTYCKVNKNALEELSLRALYGHKKYEEANDWENFSRVPNGDFEYSNAMFRHALEIGGEEDEKEHLVSSAWNAISRLEIYLRKIKNNS